MSQPLSLTTVLRSEPGWYRGDFHAHSNHSDGFYDPPQLLEAAKSEGLDFFAITDHNTISAFSKFGENPGLVILPGIEVTLQEGHFNVFGMESAVEWMEQLRSSWNGAERPEPYRAVNDIIRHARDDGFLVSINHPLLVPWEWRDHTTILEQLNCLEIWNDPSWPDNVYGNPAAVEMWTRWLNAGYRIAGIGGSDFHRPEPLPGQEKPAERIGSPSTYVHAEELSGRAILDALLRRRAYVSMGPLVSFEANVEGRRYGMGDVLEETGGTVELMATVSSCSTRAHARILKNGRIVTETTVSGGDAAISYRSEITPTDASWYRFDLFDDAGQMLAITNPIFTGPKRNPVEKRFGDFLPVRTA